MKNKEILELSRGLAICGELKGIKIAYAIAKNSKIISREMEALAEAIKKLQEDHAKKDEKGKPIIKNDKYLMVDEDKFNEEYKELMDIENEIKLHTVKKEDLPKDVSAKELMVIMEFLTE